MRNCKKSRISVNLTQNEYEILDLEANKLDVSISWLARKAIQQYIDDPTNSENSVIKDNVRKK